MDLKSMGFENPINANQFCKQSTTETRGSNEKRIYQTRERFISKILYGEEIQVQFKIKPYGYDPQEEQSE